MKKMHVVEKMNDLRGSSASEPILPVPAKYLILCKPAELGVLSKDFQNIQINTSVL